MISPNESDGAKINLPTKNHIPSHPHQQLVVTPFNLLNETGWLCCSSAEIRAHSSELLFNLHLPGKSHEVCQFIKHLGKRFPNCRLTVLESRELSAVAKKAHVRLVTPRSLHLLKCPHFLFYDDIAQKDMN